MKKTILLLLLLVSMVSYSQKKETITKIDDGWYRATYTKTLPLGFYESDYATIEWVYVKNGRITSIGNSDKALNELDGLNDNPKYISGGVILYKKTKKRTIYSSEIIYKYPNSKVPKSTPSDEIDRRIIIETVTYNYKIKIDNEKL
ncbi:MAG: hypothetical protein QM478_13600 [Flavobacteriaceae bacterium]